jgi:glycosyltransferase involved in cell wall biosynthesis
MAERVHVLHIVRTLTVDGGMERSMKRVIEGLAGRNIRHTVLLLSDAEDVLDLAHLAPLLRVCPRRRDPRTSFGIWRQLCRLHPTVIHVRNWGPWIDTTLARLVQRPRVPLVWSFHGVEDIERLPPARRSALRAASLLTSRIFAVSRATRALLVGLVGIPERRIDVIANGVDAEYFVPPPSSPRPHDRFVIGSVGRLAPIKNHALLIEAAADLVARGIDLEVRIAGTGSTEAALRELAAARAIEDRIRLLGHVEDVRRFLWDLDLFALTSDMEGSPNAVLEAMACGVPVVATAVGGVEEQLDGGRCGVLVARRDRAALERAIEGIVASPEARRAYAALARARIVEWYALASMLDAYETLYRAPGQ